MKKTTRKKIESHTDSLSFSKGVIDEFREIDIFDKAIVD